MIRKLKNGKCLLYSKKKDPKTGQRRNLGTFIRERPPRSMSAKVSFSSDNE